MKRLFSILMALFCLTAFAQTSDSARDNNPPKEGGFVLNPEIGGNATSYPDRTNNLKLGYQLGVNVRLGNSVYLQPGIHLVKQAVNANVDTASLSGSYQDISAYYVQFPVVLGVKLINTTPLNLRLYGGATANIFLGGEVENSKITKEDFNKSVYALRAGLGLDVLIFTVNSYIDWGISDVYARPANISYYSLSVAVGVKIF